MAVSTKEDLRTKEDFEGKPNAEFIPDKKDGVWSFAHDKKQIIGDLDIFMNVINSDRRYSFVYI